MKQIIRYRFMTIPNKINGDIRLTVEEQRTSVYTAMYDGGKSVNVMLFPIISVGIVHPGITGENGRITKAPWNPNDNIALTKFNLPIFTNELKQMYNDMKTPDLYTYHGERLELNESAASKIRRIFVIGTTTIELSPIVIERENAEPIEGIKLKFNNEDSSQTLSLNELYSMIDQLNKLNVDTIVFSLYQSYISANGNVERTETVARV